MLLRGRRPDGSGAIRSATEFTNTRKNFLRETGTVSRLQPCREMCIRYGSNFDCVP